MKWLNSIMRRSKKKLKSKPREYYMNEARKQALESNCQQTHWGAIVVDHEGEIIGRGFNYVPTDELYRYCNPCIRKDIRSSTQHEMCSARHAEVIALENVAVEHGIDGAEYCDMYLYGYNAIEDRSDKPIIMEYYPCMDCAKAMIYFGVQRVFLYRPVATTKEEELWLPKDELGDINRYSFDLQRKYKLDWISNKQLWYHPSVWLGLAGRALKPHFYNYKLGKKYRPAVRENKVYEFMKLRLGEKILYKPDDEELSLMVWMVEQILQNGYFDFSEYEIDLDKKMAFVKLLEDKPRHFDDIITLEWVNHDFQIRRVKERDVKPD